MRMTPRLEGVARSFNFKDNQARLAITRHAPSDLSLVNAMVKDLELSLYYVLLHLLSKSQIGGNFVQFSVFFIKLFQQSHLRENEPTKFLRHL
jgi:hypothetical protein